MILHYLRQKENKDQAKANIIYTDIINLVNLFFKNNINFDKRNFLNTFYITSFFLYITFYIIYCRTSPKLVHIPSLLSA